MSEVLRQYIDARKAYFWYTPEAGKGNISESLLVENILNEGTLDDFRALARIMGLDHMADVFFSAQGRAAQNYYPEIRNLFTLVFNRYAHHSLRYIYALHKTSEEFLSHGRAPLRE